jgi:flagellin-specific chaperone FliS
MQMFHTKQMGGCGHEELQNLCSSYLILMLFEGAQKVQHASKQIIHNTQYNVHAENINITFQKQREALEQRTLQLQEWGDEMQTNMLELENKWHAEQNMTAQLKQQLSTIEAEHDLLAKRAICAPPYFDALHWFIVEKCVQHPDERVSSEEFHKAFDSHIMVNHPCMERPNQRDLTAMMKRLGLNNEQVYVHGGNARGFKGLGLLDTPAT